MNSDDLIYLIAGVLREIGLEEVTISEDTICQVMEAQDQVSCWQTYDGSVVVRRRAGLVVEHGCD